MRGKVWLCLSFLAVFWSQTALAKPDPMLSVFQSRHSPPSSEAKIFLLAGSSQNANFAQEILDQKKLWLSQGFREDEIACYYVVPTRKEFFEDEDQFRTLADALAACYPASVKLLREHLRMTASAGNPEFLYLFVTTHGQRPVSLRLKNRDPEDEGYDELVKLSKYPALDQYLLGIEGLPGGRANEGQILQSLDVGTDPREVLLSPNYLREILAQYYPQTPKYLVLQGCYSGGFLKDPRKGYKKQVLSELDQVTVLTAARFDRPSFGCHPGDEVTYFGGVYNEVLSDLLDHPSRMKWKRLYSEIKEKVKLLEEREEMRVRHSEPGFYSNL